MGFKTGQVRGRTDVMEGDEGVFVLSSWHETYELMSWNHRNIRCKYIKEAKAINLWEIRCDPIVNNWIVVRTILSVCHEQHSQRLSSAVSSLVFNHISQNIFTKGNIELLRCCWMSVRPVFFLLPINTDILKWLIYWKKWRILQMSGSVSSPTVGLFHDKQGQADQAQGCGRAQAVDPAHKHNKANCHVRRHVV